MCHSENSMISWPTPGAMTGMTMNTMKTSDMTSAIRAAAEDVADDRDGDDPGGRRADALDEAQAKQHGEGRREGRREGRGDIDGQAEQQRRAPAEPVGDRAVEKLRAAEAQDIGGDDILPVVLVLDAEAGADLLQAGQHDVDGQRIERHQRGGQRDEFPARNGSAKPVCRRRSLLVHGASRRPKNENAPESRRIDTARAWNRAVAPIRGEGVRRRGR